MLLGRKLVMLADDDPEFLAELQEALALSGFVPVPVTNGADAVKMSRKIKPDVILLDLKLGAENGFVVAEKIRQDPVTAGIPVIMMSGHFRDAQLSGALPPSNINIYLSKPFSQRDVVFGIQKALSDIKEPLNASNTVFPGGNKAAEQLKE